MEGIMKAKKFSKKLTLNKKTIANLENKKMNAIRGGAHPPTDPNKGCFTGTIIICCE
jgi:natural product precursor